MSTPSICSFDHPMRHPTAPAPRPWFAILILAPLAAGCTYSGGELLFALGFGKGRKVEAEFRLTDAPVMIFVDDYQERLGPPEARRHLFDKLAQQLLRHKAAKKIVPRQTIEQLQQSVPDFDQRGCREIGEMAGAEQVLWIEVQDYLAGEYIFEADHAAYFVATVKVINVLETERPSRVRVWPQSPLGRTVSATMNGNEVATAESPDTVVKELSTRLADEIARLFYDHRAPEFEREG